MLTNMRVLIVAVVLLAFGASWAPAVEAATAPLTSTAGASIVKRVVHRKPRKRRHKHHKHKHHRKVVIIITDDQKANPKPT